VLWVACNDYGQWKNCLQEIIFFGTDLVYITFIIYKMKKKLVLESGEVFYGEGFGFNQEIEGEVVFNTSMTGYQELISDPSYCGQIVCMTYPLIGNYGINRDDFESMEPAIKGLIVKEVADLPSNFRSIMNVDEFFQKRKL